MPLNYEQHLFLNKYAALCFTTALLLTFAGCGPWPLFEVLLGLAALGRFAEWLGGK